MRALQMGHIIEGVHESPQSILHKRVLVSSLGCKPPTISLLQGTVPAARAERHDDYESGQYLISSRLISFRHLTIPIAVGD